MRVLPPFPFGQFSYTCGCGIACVSISGATSPADPVFHAQLVADGWTLAENPSGRAELF